MGLEHAKKLARWYVDLPYEENSELFFLLSSAFTENWLPVVHQVRTQITLWSIASPQGSLMTPFELAPPACAVIGDNGLKEVQQGALVDGFVLTDLNRPRCQVPLSLVDNALGIGHDGVVDENVEMILRSKPRADVAMQRKIGLLGALDGLGHVRVGGVHQISHLAAHLLLPARESMNVVVDAGVGLVCTHGSMIPRIKVVLATWSICSRLMREKDELKVSSC